MAVANTTKQNQPVNAAQGLRRTIEQTGIVKGAGTAVLEEDRGIPGVLSVKVTPIAIDLDSDADHLAVQVLTKHASGDTYVECTPEHGADLEFTDTTEAAAVFSVGPFVKIVPRFEDTNDAVYAAAAVPTGSISVEVISN